MANLNLWGLFWHSQVLVKISFYSGPLSTFSLFLSQHASGFLVTVCFCFSVYRCFARMYTYAPLCVGCHQRLEEGICHEAPSGCRELNPDLLEEQPGLF